MLERNDRFSYKPSVNINDKNIYMNKYHISSDFISDLVQLMKVTNMSINVKISHYTYKLIKPFTRQEKRIENAVC